MRIGSRNIQQFASGGGGLPTRQELIEIFKKNPAGLGLYPGEQVNTEYLVLAAAILRVNGSYSYGNPIDWTILNYTDSHGDLFFNNIEAGSPTNALNLLFPPVKKVINFTVTTDETFSANGVIVGASVDLDKANIFAYNYWPDGSKLYYNGSNWIEDGVVKLSFTVSGGTFYFNSSNTNVTNYFSFPIIIYTGPNNYHIKQVYSGLGAYNFGFNIVDAAGSTVTSFTTDDYVYITGLTCIRQAVQLDIWYTNNKFMAGGTANFWTLGIFEAFFIVDKLTSTSNYCRWQAYTGASSYKIYRDTNSDFSTEVLIYSGTDLIFEDTGLTTQTAYYYKMVAVISALDTEITTFKQITY